VRSDALFKFGLLRHLQQAALYTYLLEKEMMANRNKNVLKGQLILAPVVAWG
jgi:hypothetical protein